MVDCSRIDSYPDVAIAIGGTNLVLTAKDYIVEEVNLLIYNINFKYQ